jgi:hypothetical protein
MSDREKLALAERLLRDDCSAEDRKSASDLIVTYVIERNDVLRALRLR